MMVLNSNRNRDDIFKGKDLVTNDQRLLKLPTIEAQLAAWIRGYEQGMVSRWVIPPQLAVAKSGAMRHAPIAASA